MTLVIHLGPHKTATTYLQSNFRSQRGDLLKRGWLYPVTGVRTGLAHHDVAENVDQIVAGAGATFDDLGAAARKARAEGVGVLLSAEGFRRWRPGQIKALAKVFGERDLRLVYVLRDPMTVVRSMWAQSVKLGSTTELPDFLSQHMRKRKQSRLLNPLKDLSPHLRRKRADFTILLYDEIDRRGADIFSTFMSEALSIADARPTAEIANARAPIEMTEFLRLISIVGGFDSSRGRVDVGDAVRHLFSPAERNAIVETIREHGAGARRTIEVRRDTPYYEKLESKLRQEAGDHFRPDPGTGRLFPATTDTWTCYDAKALMRAPEVARTVERATARLKPNGLRLVVLNQGYRTLMAGRRLRNRLFRDSASKA